MDKTDETWRGSSENPPVAHGSEGEFIVAVRRARNGKVYSFAATYLNGYRLRYEYECPDGEKCQTCDEDGHPTTGWFRETGDDGEGSRYHAVSLDEGDEFLGWRNVPQWPTRR